MSGTEQELGDEIARVRHGQDVTASDLANRLMPWLDSHDKRVHEKCARIAVSMTDNEPDGYYGQACSEVAAAIREASDD